MTEKDYQAVLHNMKDVGLDLTKERLQINIPDAESVLRLFLSKRMGSRFVWLPEYDRVVEWMSDSQGKGLFLKGNVGRGKTEIGRNTIPLIINYYYRKIVKPYDAVDLSAKKGEFLDGSFPLCIDDIGTEDVKSREVFKLLADQMEKRSRFLIVTTNLTSDEILHTYGERVLNRLKGNTTSISFNGESMRG